MSVVDQMENMLALWKCAAARCRELHDTFRQPRPEDEVQDYRRLCEARDFARVEYLRLRQDLTKKEA